MKGLRENWFLILFLGGIVMGWANFSNRLNATENAQQELKQDNITIKAEQQELRAAVIESKASFIYIKESIAELKAKK